MQSMRSLRRASLFVFGIALAGFAWTSLLVVAEPALAQRPTLSVDADMDGDVDQEDFGAVQRCLTGPEFNPNPGCESFDVNGDTHIDDIDLAVFSFCMRGPGVMADPACTDYQPPVPPMVAFAASLKAHPNRGISGISLLSGDNTEPRQGGPTEVYIGFDQDIASIGPEWWQRVISSHAPLNIVWDERSITISYLGIPDRSCLDITLHGITAADNPLAIMPDRLLQIATLIGDGNNDHVVTYADEDWPYWLPGLFPYRWDYNCDGLLGAMDALVIWMNVGHTASCPP